MSTRSTITVRDRKDGNEAYHIYRHSDGYPDTQHGVIATLPEAFKFAWQLPRYEADDFAAAIVSAWKDGAGNIRFSQGRDAHGDTEFHYEVYQDGGKVYVECYSSEYPDGWDNARVWKKSGKTRILKPAKISA